MALNPNIILQGQPVNVLGAMDSGTVAGLRAYDGRRQRQFHNALSQHGGGLVSGDRNAMNALSAFDPGMVMDVQNVQSSIQDRDRRFEFTQAEAQRDQGNLDRNFELDRQEVEMARQEAQQAARAALQSQQAEVQAEALAREAEADQQAAATLANMDRETYERIGARIAQERGEELVPWEDRAILIGSLAGGADAAMEYLERSREVGEPGGGDATAPEARIARLVQGGMPQELAQGVVDGRIDVRTDPTSGLVTAIDIANGQTLWTNTPGASQQGVDLLPEDSQFKLEDGAAGNASFGFSGLGLGAINTLFDAVAAGQPAPGVDNFQRNMQTLGQRTAVAFSIEFPGRPTNFTYEQGLARTVQPGEISTGPERARNKIATLRNDLARQYNAAANVINNPERYTREQRAKAQEAMDLIGGLYQEYDALHQALNSDGVPEAEFQGSAEGTGANSGRFADMDILEILDIDVNTLTPEERRQRVARMEEIERQ